MQDVRGVQFRWELVGDTVRLTGPQLLSPGVQMRRYMLEVHRDQWESVVAALGIYPGAPS